MKERAVMILLAAAFAISLFGCAGSKGAQTDSTQENAAVSDEANAAGTDAAETTESVADADETQTEENLTSAYPSEDAGTVVQESALGYSMVYDPTVFTLDDTDGMDTYTYNTAESLDAPVYLSVQSYTDMDAETLAEGLVLQSGMDGVEAQDVNFGADGVESKLVYIEKEADGVKQVQIFYAVPAEEGSLLVEIESYAGVPESVDWRFEEMLGTFTLR